MVTEFGAEANRDGPVEEKGTWAFQQDFVNFHLATYAQKPWLSGALYWALNEFRVRPGWEGGNPRPPRRCTRRACSATATSHASPPGRTCGATTPRRSSSAGGPPSGSGTGARRCGGAASRAGRRAGRRPAVEVAQALVRAQPDRGGHGVGQRQAAGR